MSQWKQYFKRSFSVNRIIQSFIQSFIHSCTDIKLYPTSIWENLSAKSERIKLFCQMFFKVNWKKREKLQPFWNSIQLNKIDFLFI